MIESWMRCGHTSARRSAPIVGALVGQQAEKAVEDARETVARVLKCTPKEIIFTSCGTEIGSGSRFELILHNL